MRVVKELSLKANHNRAPCYPFTRRVVKELSLKANHNSRN